MSLRPAVWLPRWSRRQPAGRGEPLALVPGRRETLGSVGIATTTPSRLPLVVFQRTESRAFQVLGRAGAVDTMLPGEAAEFDTRAPWFGNADGHPIET